MDFVEAETTQERLLLALIEKVEDNTAAITQLIELGREKHGGRKQEGNVLMGFKPPRRFTVEEEAQWIKRELEAHGSFVNNIKPNHDCRDHMFIKYMQNVELLRANGFDVSDNDWPERTPDRPPAPGYCCVKWTPEEAHR